ncbi:MAG: HyaD/HybD family hydrogenase maturation endopeptidase [Sterolibacteriaceae bacterium]|jgi:hydrogenase maturation protease|uniref:HyaD/HybD family hydrogenase maturation endopeptidase n=1 Tax=Candidatus Methylophosphatis roskildensis TaxID=2899263 RepID=A0A9D7HRN6_9PROT|nr:HyaD/HybD family hydrogenase maturation endopeptidase [Candidatus Methylophosphatis roskildensis]MBK7236100.1 HyaD/HybD family hydrogenase maturation endopeptidase [Sterolibacteriaceae bacterium]
MRVLVLGLGNILLRDEGVGVRVIEALADRYAVPAGVEVVDGGTSGMDLLDTIAGCDHLLICDAVRADAPPASVIRLADAQVPALFRNRFSPHQLGVADLLATLVLTDETPRSITLIGVVPVDLALGLELSPEVALAAERALECLVAELRGRGFKLELRAPASASTA